MSKSRVIAFSTALAVGASALVAPQSFAATVGAAKNDKCSMTYTEAELETLENVNNSAFEAVSDALYEAFEAAFPGARAIAERFAKEPLVLSFIQSESADDIDYEPLEAVADKYVADLRKLGLGEDAAESILDLTLMVLEFSHGSWAEFMDFKTVEALSADTLAEIRKRTKEDAREDFNELIDEALNESDLTAAQAAKMRKSLKGNKALEAALDDFSAVTEAYKEALIACAGGGSQEVAFPTKQTLSQPKNDAGDKKTRGDKNDAKAGDNKVNGTKTDAPANEGPSASTELSPGAIAGIVLGVLALVGIVGVVAAPMLGIQLPFDLPF